MSEYDIAIAAFVFLLGACVGSFLNVVVYRLPRDQSIVHPPSACPKCNHRLAAFDNIPILGWIFLHGKCRYCKNPISPRYPIVELITALLFLGHFLALTRFGMGPCAPRLVMNPAGMQSMGFDHLIFENDWAIVVMHLWLIASLLAASLIDSEHFIIPLWICWLCAIVGGVGHTFFVKPAAVGDLRVDALTSAMALGAGVGLVISILLQKGGVLQRSFDEEEPMLEKDVESLPEDEQPDPWPASRIRAEIRREMVFLMPAIVLGSALVLLVNLTGFGETWHHWMANRYFSGLLGSLFGALVGGGLVWFFRIAGSYAFGREAMGLGDVHLMFGVGAIVGALLSSAAFFIAPVFGLVYALGQLFLKGRRELPYGPYLSLGTWIVMLFSCSITAYLTPGIQGFVYLFNSFVNPGSDQ